MSDECQHDHGYNTFIKAVCTVASWGMQLQLCTAPNGDWYHFDATGKPADIYLLIVAVVKAQRPELLALQDVSEDICAFAESVLVAAEALLGQTVSENSLGTEATRRFHKGDVSSTAAFAEWNSANAMAIRDAAKRATSGSQCRTQALETARLFLIPKKDVNGFDRATVYQAAGAYPNLRVVKGVHDWEIPPPTLLGGPLAEADIAECTRIAQQDLGDGLYPNIHDLAAHLFSRALAAEVSRSGGTKRSDDVPAAPRDAKASKGQRSDDVPAAVTRKRSNSRTPTIGDDNPGDVGLAHTALPRTASQPIAFGPSEVEQQKDAAAVQHKHMEAQMRDVQSRMQAVRDRVPAPGQLP